MKNQKGFSPIFIVLIVILVGAGTYAVVKREALKSYFEKGDKPAESQRTELKDKFQDGDIPAGRDSAKGDKPTAGQFNAVIDSDIKISEKNEQQENAHNLLPEDKKKLAADEALKAIAFRWTPLVPKPKEPVTYRLRVWQLMQGQNGTPAMKSSQPIVTKDAGTATEVAVSGIYTGPCKPPYLCDFAWDVQAIAKSGAVLGTSEQSTFSVIEPAASTEINGSTGAR